MGTVTVVVTRHDEHNQVEVHAEPENEFQDLMCAAEYLTCIVAGKSRLGFEQALDKIREGAMTYRHQEVDR